MRNLNNWKKSILSVSLLLAVTLSGCNTVKTPDEKAPDVNITTTAPDPVNVEVKTEAPPAPAPDVNVTTETTNVEAPAPDVNVSTETTTVDTPAPDASVTTETTTTTEQ